MSILLLVRNFLPAHEMIERGDWKVADVARNAFDLEGKVVGTIGAGRIGYRVLQRLKPFDCKELLYYDYNPLPDGEFQCIEPRSSKPILLYRGRQCCRGEANFGPQGCSNGLDEFIVQSLTTSSRNSSPNAMLSRSTLHSTRVPAGWSTPNCSSTSRMVHGW
jgi:D-isomer specific 2-hydroxyacid dehydrogenase, NAD binding domain